MTLLSQQHQNNVLIGKRDIITRYQHRNKPKPTMTAPAASSAPPQTPAKVPPPPPQNKGSAKRSAGRKDKRDEEDEEYEGCEPKKLPRKSGGPLPRLLSDDPKLIRIFVDGSYIKTDTNPPDYVAGWAYVPEGKHATYGPVNLNPELASIYNGIKKPTSFNAELTALLEALGYINEQPSDDTKYSIVGDCSGALDAARGYSSPNQDIELVKLLRNEWSRAEQRQTTATWTASHQGNVGNEMAYLAAKRAC